MKRTLTVIALALAALAASAERYTPATGSLVRVEGTSTLHDWKMEGSTIQGQIAAPAPDQWNGEAKAVVTIPVTSIKSDKAKMDRLMADALKAKAHPEIRFELLDATPAPAGGESYVMKTRGKLTIAGVTREIDLDVRVEPAQGGRYALSGQVPIKMTAFGIKPPTAMLNTIKTADDVTVTFRWVVQKQ